MKDFGISVTLATAALMDCWRTILSYKVSVEKRKFSKVIDSCNSIRGGLGYGNLVGTFTG